MRRMEARLQFERADQGQMEAEERVYLPDEERILHVPERDPTANTVGATANLLLVVNEAQDISTFKYDKDIEPMVASANATRLFSGTRWTTDTLLEREYQRSLEDEKRDGIQRVFFFTAEEVRKYVPAYGEFIDGVVEAAGQATPAGGRRSISARRSRRQAGMFPAAGRQ